MARYCERDPGIRFMARYCERDPGSLHGQVLCERPRFTPWPGIVRETQVSGGLSLGVC